MSEVKKSEVMSEVKMSEVIMSKLKMTTLPTAILFQLLILYSVIIYLINMVEFLSLYISSSIFSWISEVWTYLEKLEKPWSSKQ